MLYGSDRIKCDLYLKIEKWMLLFLCSLVPVLLLDTTVYASSKADCMEKACVAALEAIQPINEKKLEVTIDDAYNVINTEGELIGYSLGYSVGNKSYGYAIYNIEDENIKEFVFEKGIENLYTELKEECYNKEYIDETEVTDCLLYEGGMDYCLVDDESNYISTDDIFFGDNEDDAEKMDESIDIENILDSEANVTLPGSLLPDNKGVAEYYYNSNVNYWGMNVNSNGDVWNIVPDYKLTMINQEYYMQNAHKYCCSVSAGVGCLNWMGMLVNDSLVDTYNTIWSICGMSTVRNSVESDGNTYAYYPLNLNEIDDAVNIISQSMGSGMRARYVVKPTFKQLEDSITRSTVSESYPAIVSICDWYYNEKNEYVSEGHSVIVDSYIKKKKASSAGYDNYIGIYQNWYGGCGGVDDAESKFELIRYLNYDAMINDNRVIVEGVLFSNVSSRNIKEPNTSYVSGNTIEVACDVPYGTRTVYFPTWTDANGQDDLVWHQGNIMYGSVATCSIDLNSHNKESGIYITHIYAYDGNGNLLARYGSLFNTVNTAVKNVNVSGRKINGYKVKCTLPTGTAYVKFPTWSDADGQDDIIWHTGAINDGKGSVTIDVADHGNCGGKYITHIYAYDKYNKCISVSGTTVFMSSRTQIESAKVTYISSDKFNISCYVPVGTSKVSFTVFALEAGRSGIKTYNIAVSSSTGFISNTIESSEFENVKGNYLIHINAYDSKGRMIGSTVNLSAEL